HTRECVLFHPYLDICVDIVPQSLAVELGRLSERVRNAGMGIGSLSPACVIGYPIEREVACTAQEHKIILNLGVTSLRFLYDAADSGLVERLPDRHWLHGIDDLDQLLTPELDLGLGRPLPLYGASHINEGFAHGFRPSG